MNDYGVRINWNEYSKKTRFLCLIPILNLFFTTKLEANVVGLSEEGRPLLGLFATLRLPKLLKDSQGNPITYYRVLAKFPLEDTVVIDNIFVYFNKKGVRVAEADYTFSKEHADEWVEYRANKLNSNNKEI